jgi:hypothetical protein
MKDRHLSIRVPSDLHARLSRHARGGSRSVLANRLIDEGLRMEEHPGVIFRPGPAGRRPGLVGGPDIWEIARVLRDLSLRGEDLVRKAADLTGLPAHEVRAAHRYYDAHRDEIDEWIDAVDEDADTAQR